MRKEHFQSGWLSRKKLASGEFVYFNFREYQGEGKPRTRTIKLGPTTKLKTDAAAWRAVKESGIDANKDEASPSPATMTVKELANHFRLRELEGGVKQGYESYITNHIVPKWGDSLLTQIRTVAVEEWLKNLMRMPRKPGETVKPLTAGSRVKVRNIMRVLFNHAIRHELTAKNPIELVRQSSKRQKELAVLVPEEITALLDQLSERDRAMVILAVGTGLRRSELFALKWSDFDFDGMSLRVDRSILFAKEKHIGICKTETSRKPVPIDEAIVEFLTTWREQTAHGKDDDWVFASVTANGKHPLWPDMVMEDYIRTAAKRAGIAKRIGWHTFRRTYSTLLLAHAGDVKVAQELMRHANSSTTLNIYSQALTERKREAQAAVVKTFVN